LGILAYKDARKTELDVHHNSTPSKVGYLHFNLYEL